MAQTMHLVSSFGPVLLNTNTYGKSGTDGNDGHGNGRRRSAWRGERCGLNVCVVPSLNGRGLSI